MCEYCAIDSPIYDLGLRCCRARYTYRPQHSKSEGIAWANYWRRMFSVEEAEATLAEAKACTLKSRQSVLTA
jgi:hypothetical protein